MPDLISFRRELPVSSEGVAANVRHALSLRLPELRDFEYPHEGTLKVIANGPSARSADLSGPTLALNGALRLFTDAGLAPTYWAACDPQELVADFLTTAPARTTYLVNSQCHPKVFERLRERNVVLWHIDSHAAWPYVEDRFPVYTASSVTICAFELMGRLGWRAFETWGWDGCIMDGEENAVAQFNAMRPQTVMLGDQSFESSVAWAAEAEDAWHKLGEMRWPLAIRGGGMIGAIFEALRAKQARDSIASATNG